MKSARLKINASLITTLLVSSLLPLFAEPAKASGMSEYKLGEIVQTSVCVPRNAKSPIYLITMPDKERVMTIKFGKLTKSKRCNSYPGRAYLISSAWVVNIAGETHFNFHVPNLKKTFDGFPDVISVPNP
jgi:hypothetical protein